MGNLSLVLIFLGVFSMLTGWRMVRREREIEMQDSSPND